jgi:hypothetical protein
VILTALVALLVLTGPVADEAPGPVYGGSGRADAVEITGWDAGPDTSGSAADRSRGALLAADRPVVRYVHRYVPTCPGNTPNAGTFDTLCAGSASGCPPGTNRHWGYRSPAAAEPRVWVRTSGVRCLGPGVPGADGAEVVVGFTVDDFRRLPLPPGSSAVQPPSGDLLINLEANVYAEAVQVVLPAAVLGAAVQVRATPVAYAWDFGDGTVVGPTTDPGAPYPDLRNTHVYTVPGAYAITLTTTYAGEFSVGGGPWLPIDGTASVTSPPEPVTARSAANQLVAEPLG